MAKTSTLVVTDWASQPHFAIFGSGTVAAGNLVLPADGTYPSATATTTHDLTGSTFAAEIVTPPNAGNGSVQMSLGMRLDPNNYAYLSWENGNLSGSYYLNGVGNWGNGITYNPAVHRYIRMRETAGTLYWEFSTDGATWTIIRQAPNPFALTSLTVYLQAGNWNSSPDPGTATWGKVNSFGAVTPPVMGMGPAVVKMRASNGSWLNVTLRLLPLGYGPVTIAPEAIKPTNYTQEQLDTHMQSVYTQWKTHLRQKAENGWWAVLANAQGGTNPYVAEGQGYGLMILPQMAPYDALARSYFDGIVKYVLDHPSAIDPDLHAAEQDINMVSHNGADCATDGDMDIAMGLLMGHARWGSTGTHNYLELARTRINAIKRTLISPVTGLLELGDWSNGAWQNVSRPSDWMIGHFEQFQWATSDTSWFTIRDAHLAAVARLQEFYAGRTGLLPDFTVNPPATIAPAPPDTLEGPHDGRYYYNACRTPWRLGAAQSIPAREAATRISNWAKQYTGGTVANFTAGYYLNGTPLNAYTDMSFTAPLAVAASVAGDQPWLNSIWARLVANPASDYYPASIQLLTMIQVAGSHKLTPSTAPPVISIGYEQATVNVDATVRSHQSTTINTGGTTTTKSFTMPVQVQQGDLLIAYLSVSSGSLANASTLRPAGWTELGRVVPSTTAIRHVVFWRVATGSEPASYNYGSLPTTVTGSTLVLSIRDWSGTTADLGTTANGGFAMSANNNSISNGLINTPSVTPRTARSLLLTSSASSNSAGATWGWIPPTTAGAAAYSHNTPSYYTSMSASQENVGAGATGTRQWRVNTASTVTLYMTSSLSIPSGTRTQSITRMLSDQAKTLGQGGPLTDTTDNVFEDSTGLSSIYHLYADGLDWSKDVGLLVYTDGSAETGLSNPSSSYVVGGAGGMRAVAKRQNMVLLTPRAPGDGCRDGDGVCWYDHSLNGVTPHQKTDWSNELIRWILTRYNIDRRRIAIGGYSSGAQWTTGWWGPKYGPEIIMDGVAVAISYGGQPQSTPRLTDAYKANVEHIWDVGDADDAYTKPTWDNGVQTGRAWYQANGFATTDLVLLPGVGHNRYDTGVVGDFGRVMEREIVKYVRSAGPEPTTGLRPAVYRSHTSTGKDTAVVDKTAPLPFIVRAGDVIVAVLGVYNGTVASAALPAGFTQIGTHTRSTAHRVILGYKVATANEPATYTPVLSGTQSFRLDLIVLGNVDVARIGTPATVTTTASSAGHAAPSVTPTTPNGILMSFVSGGGGNVWTPPTQMDEVTDAYLGAATYLTVSTAIESRTVGGATGTRTFAPGSGSFTQVAGSVFFPSLGS